MLGKLLGLFKLADRYRHRPKPDSPDQVSDKILPDLGLNREKIQSAFGNSSDLVLRELKAGDNGKISVLVTHIDGLVDKQLVSKTVMEQITGSGHLWQSPGEMHRDLKFRVLTSSEVEEITSLGDLLVHVSSGNSAVIIDGVSAALICNTRGGERRSVEEPTNEASVRGPREGFVESLRTNTSILRRKIRDHRLRIEQQKIGRVSKTEVAVIYIAGLTPGKTVQEIKNRLGGIDTDSIQESGHLEEFIEDAPFSPFPTMLRTERPDRVMGGLLEGRVAILTDGTPFALIVPSTFTMFLGAPEDYFERFYIASSLRILRMITFFLSLTLPSLYVAVTTYHQEMLPTPLILSIAAQREGIPFPAMVEALIMEFIFEVLREAGVRLPQVVGAAVSIIGALVLGEAAMRAGLVSPAMVMVVALTGIASFATPVFSLAIGTRLIRFPMILLAASLGLFGIVAGLFALLIHLTSLRSFGVPYMEPLAPVVSSDLKDSLIRFPWWAMRSRPKLVGFRDPIRQGPGQEPQPPDPEEQKKSPPGKRGSDQ